MIVARGLGPCTIGCVSACVHCFAPFPLLSSLRLSANPKKKIAILLLGKKGFCWAEVGHPGSMIHGVSVAYCSSDLSGRLEVFVVVALVAVPSCNGVDCCLSPPGGIRTILSIKTWAKA